MTEETKALKWSIVLGTNPGYDSSVRSIMDETEFLTHVQDIADKVHEDTGLYISAVFFPASVIYKKEWGCPSDGEPVYILTGCVKVNSENLETCRSSLFLFTEELRKKLRQCTVTLDITQTDFYRFEEASI